MIMEKTILELRTAISPPYCTEEQIEIRSSQISNGMKKLFEYKQNFIDNNCDVFLLDNTIKDFDSLPESIKQIALENNLEIIFSPHNKYGKHNKGAGDIENLKFVKEKLEKYKWFIHFEPRQLLVSHQFFDSFFKKPRDLFTYNENPNAVKHFNTGLYAAETKNILSFINAFSEKELQNMVLNSVSIEYILHDFYVKNQIKFGTLSKMDLIWYYDYDNNYKHW